MKLKPFFVLCLSIIPAILCARQVKKVEAQLVAHRFLQNNIIKQPTAPLHHSAFIDNIDSLYAQDQNEKIAYIGHIQPEGFIIVSCDTDVQPVIAYSTKHNWDMDKNRENTLYHILQNDKRLCDSDNRLLPDSLIEKNNRMWHNILDDHLAKLNSYSFRQWPQAGTTATGGWVESTWTQHAPFNNFCPIDPQTNNRSVVGCVATALSQVVNYFQTIGDLSFNASDRYVTKTRNMHIDEDSSAYDFPSFERLNSYLSDLKQKYQNSIDPSEQEIAALDFACGIALKTDYTSSGSGAHINSVDFILQEKFEYYSAQHVDNLINEKSSSGFYFALQENMMNALPAILKIGVSANYNLHAVVCDGYNTNGFYHLNFGWGSTSPDPITDAWYLLPDGMPANYQMVLEAIVDINAEPAQQAQLTCDKDVVYIDATRVGEASAIDCFTLQNDRNTPIQVHYLVSSPPFSISTTTSSFADSIGPFDMPAGTEITIYAQCVPDSIGSFDGNAIVNSSAENSYLNIHLNCFGAPQDGAVISRGAVSGMWDKANSPYYICGDINVAQGTELSITQGAEIVFCDRFKMAIEPDAKVVAKGSITDSIRFHAYDPSIGWSGMQFEHSDSDDTLAYCTLSDGKGNPVGYDSGGAISLYASSPMILNSRLKNNSSFYGGAIYCSQSNPSIKFCTIEHNYAEESGGALYLQKSAPVVENTLFYKNHANTNSAFLRCSESSPSFINITVADNEDGQHLGGFMYLDSDNDLIFRNSILWSSDVDNVDIFMDRDNTIEFCYSDILTTYIDQHWPIVGYPYQNNDIIWGSGNIAQQPLFTHEDSFKYLLQENSPCIDAGDPASIYNDSEDPDNPGAALWPAMASLRNDMGAYGGGSAQFVVPVELAAFTAEVLNTTIVLTWTTLSETANYGFFVQRSTDGKTFKEIAFIKGHGTTTRAHSYVYRDQNPESGEYYYRLKQVDLNGAFCFSKTIKVYNDRPSSFVLQQNRPNPFNSSTIIKFFTPRECKILFTIYNMNGRHVKTLIDKEHPAGTHVLVWDATDETGQAVSSGAYILHMQSETFEKSIKLLLLR